MKKLLVASGESGESGEETKDEEEADDEEDEESDGDMEHDRDLLILDRYVLYGTDELLVVVDCLFAFVLYDVSSGTLLLFVSDAFLFIPISCCCCCCCCG